MALNFEFTEEQSHLKQQVYELGKRLNYLIEPCDRDSLTPWPLIEEMGRRNWITPFVPIEYGGPGKGAIEFAIITEELGRTGFMGPNPMAGTAKMLLLAGTEEQKKAFLPDLCKGRVLASGLISEHDAGTNWDLMKTVAVKKKDKYVLNGEKNHINYATEAGIFRVVAKTDKGATIFMFRVDRNKPGLLCKKTEPIGLRMEPLADVFFTNYEIPAESLLGEEGQAVDIFQRQFAINRIGNASRLLGISRGALEVAMEYAKKREVKGRMVTDYQGIRWLVAELCWKIETATLIRDKAAWKLDSGGDASLEVAMAKVAAANAAEEVTSKIFSLTGAWGLYREQPFERFWRDAMTGKVGGGSIEMLKNYIARKILGKETKTRG
jgi:alkylation response protein AidB-like acyl-CoA dehydrogenase